MANSADPDQKPTDLDLHCLQRQDISGFSRTKAASLIVVLKSLNIIHLLSCYSILMKFASNRMTCQDLLFQTHCMFSNLAFPLHSFDAKIN